MIGAIIVCCVKSGRIPLFLLTGREPSRLMERRELVRRMWRELEPELALLRVELVEIEFGRHGSAGLLRLYIDKEGGVTLDDCADVSRHIGAVLDRLDLIESEYTLEVSSPGIDRPIRKPEHFEAFLGERVKIQSEMPVDGRKRFTGELAGFEEGMITVRTDDGDYRVHVENLKKAHLDR